MSVDMSKHFSTSALIRFTLPTIAMMIFTSCYTIVDGFFVSNYAGKTALAAVNLIFPAVMILASVGMMIGTGGSALVAKTLGEGDRPRARRHFSLLIIFAFVVGSVLSLGGWFFMEPTATMLGATPGSQMHHDAALYGRMMMISLPFFILQYAFQSFFVTAGKPKYGFLVIVAAGVANILLDFLFVGVFGWGLPGAALATNIAMSLVGILYNWQLLRFIGEDGVAAYGVIMYTVMIFSAVFMGYSVGTSPLMSFQYGAQNHTEMRSLLWKSLGIIGVASIVMFLLGQWLAAPLSAIFVSYDAALLELTVSAYKLYALCFLFMGFAMYASAFFTALNNGLVSALISFLRTLVFQVAAVIVLPMLFGIDGIWLSVTVGDGLTCLVAATFMIALSGRYGYRKGGLSPKAKAKAENGD